MGISIDELFSDVEYGVFFVEFHFLMHNPGYTVSNAFHHYIPPNHYSPWFQQ